MKGEADEPTLSLLYPQSAPNEPVVLYDGKILLRHGAERAEDVKKLVETVMSDSWSFPDSRT